MAAGGAIILIGTAGCGFYGLTHNSSYYKLECLLNAASKIWFVLGDSTVGKSALTQAFHSDGSHFPKPYVMVCTT